MSKSEMRAIRRELINDCIHSGLNALRSIKKTARKLEEKRFGSQLRAYA